VTSIVFFIGEYLLITSLTAQVKEGSPEWDALAKKNTFDIRLYDYIQELFNEQKEVIETLTPLVVHEEVVTKE
jgi:hypothetical protein